jgi:hypothetical protein
LAIAQKVIEVTPATPEAIRLFLDPVLPQNEFVKYLFTALGREKANQFASVNRYLESFVGGANLLCEELANYQLALEHSAYPESPLMEQYEVLRRRGEQAIMDLHRAKLKLNEIKIGVCRFIVMFEAPNKDAIRTMRAVEEWMDAASLAEMRLTRAVGQEQNRNLQAQLALFLTFRSIVCSYDGPSTYIRQLEGALASMQALHEKALLELEVVTATRSLDETRKELSTVKFNLTHLQSQLKNQQQHAEQLNKLISLQEDKMPWVRRAAWGAGVFIVLLSVYFLLRYNVKTQTQEVGGIITQKSCQDIDRQIAKSARYATQVLIFRKFSSDLYFRANAMTCEKLHRLDSVQVGSLAELMKADFNAGHQEAGSFNGHRVLQVKDIGQDKLVVKLANRTSSDISFKVRVLELALLMHGILQTDKNGLEDDHMVIDLPVRQPQP